MSQGWMRIREAAHLMGVSQTTVRRRVDGGELRGRVGRSGRQEVFLPIKLRRELEARQTEPCTPGHLERASRHEEAEQRDTVAASAEAAQDSAKHAEAGGPTLTEGASTDAEPADADTLKRYERLAGGSLILAQQRADELQKHADTAYEQLAHTRSQLRQVRKVAFVGWGSCAAVALMALVLSLTFGMGMAEARAQADANSTSAKKAEQRADRLSRSLTTTSRTDAGDTTSDLPGAADTPAAPGSLGRTLARPGDTRRGLTAPARTVVAPTE